MIENSFHTVFRFETRNSTADTILYLIMIQQVVDNNLFRWCQFFMFNNYQMLYHFCKNNIIELYGLALSESRTKPWFCMGYGEPNPCKAWKAALFSWFIEMDIRWAGMIRSWKVKATQKGFCAFLMCRFFTHIRLVGKDWGAVCEIAFDGDDRLHQLTFHHPPPQSQPGLPDWLCLCTTFFQTVKRSMPAHH